MAKALAITAILCLTMGYASISAEVLDRNLGLFLPLAFFAASLVFCLLAGLVLLADSLRNRQ